MGVKKLVHSKVYIYRWEIIPIIEMFSFIVKGWEFEKKSLVETPSFTLTLIFAILAYKKKTQRIENEREKWNVRENVQWIKTLV